MLEGIDHAELTRLLGDIASADDGAIAVLTDWLQAQHHPWGELIALQRGGATEQATALLDRHRTRLLGPYADDSGAQFTWRNGFWEVAQITPEPNPEGIVRAVKQLVGHPMARVLRGLIINPLPRTFTTYNDWESSRDNIVSPWPKLATLAAALPTTIAHLGFGAPTGPAAAYLAMPNLASLSATFPHLTRLELTGTLPEGSPRLELPAVRELTVRFADASNAALTTIAHSKLPSLERLTLWTGATTRCVLDDVYPPADYAEDDEDGERYPPTYTAADLAALSVGKVESSAPPAQLTNLLLAGEWSPLLRHLTIRRPAWNGTHIRAIASAPLISRLESLTLTGGKVDQRFVVEGLVACKNELASLSTLALGWPLEASARTAIKQAITSASFATAPDPGPDFIFRYVATME